MRVDVCTFDIFANIQKLKNCCLSFLTCEDSQRLFWWIFSCRIIRAVHSDLPSPPPPSSELEFPTSTFNLINYLEFSFVERGRQLLL